MANDITSQILQALRGYTDDVRKEVATQLVIELKQTSPKRTGAYAKSWTKTKFRKGWIVHNKHHYRLTHLLEKGHAKTSGGRVSPKVHIRPAEERAIREFIERVERAVEGN